MTRDEIETTVMSVFSIILKQDFDAGTAITRDDTACWDSLKHMEIFFSLEDELGIEFSDEELSALDSVSKIIDCAEAKHAT